MCLCFLPSNWNQVPIRATCTCRYAGAIGIKWLAQSHNSKLGPGRNWTPTPRIGNPKSKLLLQASPPTMHIHVHVQQHIHTVTHTHIRTEMTHPLSLLPHILLGTNFTAVPWAIIPRSTQGHKASQGSLWLSGTNWQGTLFQEGILYYYTTWLPQLVFVLPALKLFLPQFSRLSWAKSLSLSSASCMAIIQIAWPMIQQLNCSSSSDTCSNTHVGHNSIIVACM